jgi:hypothetical protein
MTGRAQAKVQECTGYNGQGNEAGSQRLFLKPSLMRVHRKMPFPFEIKMRINADLIARPEC